MAKDEPQNKQNDAQEVFVRKVGRNWFPNEKQYEDIRNGLFAKNSSEEVVRCMKRGEAYDLAENRGYCLILNQSIGRPGSEFDEICTKRLMEEQLGMRVKPLIDVTAEQFKKKLSRLLKKYEVKSCGCFVAILMAHGHGQELGMVDYSKIHLDRDVLQVIGSSPALSGKPKLIFVEACERPSRDILYPFSDYPKEADSDEEGTKEKMIDTVLMRATHLPEGAARHQSYGALFIQALCEVLKRCADHLDLDCIRQRTISLMRCFEYRNKIQVSSGRYNTLTRKFYFLSKDLMLELAKPALSDLRADWYPNKNLFDEMNSHHLQEIDKKSSGSQNGDFCLIGKERGNGTLAGFDLLFILKFMEKHFGMVIEFLPDCSSTEFTKKLSEMELDNTMIQYGSLVAIFLASGSNAKWDWSEVIEAFNTLPSIKEKPKIIVYDGVETLHDEDYFTSVPELFIVEASRPRSYNRFGTIFSEAFCELLKRCAHQLDVGRISGQVIELIDKLAKEDVHYQTASICCDTLGRPFFFCKPFLRSETDKVPRSCAAVVEVETTLLFVGGNPSTSVSDTFNRSMEVHTEGNLNISVDHYQAFLYEHMVFGFGGSYPKARLFKLDLPGNNLRLVSKHPIAQKFFSSCQLDDTKLLLSAGGENFDSETLKTTHMINLETFEWNRIMLPDMNECRRCHSLALFNGCPTISGGREDFRDLNIAEKFVLDGGRDQWVVLPPLQNVRFCHSSAVLGGLLIIAGGKSLSSVETLDERMDEWKVGPSLQQWRQFFPMVVYEGKVFAIGGEGGTLKGKGETLASTEWWDLRWPQWNPGPFLMQARKQHGAVVVPKELVPVG